MRVKWENIALMMGGLLLVVLLKALVATCAPDEILHLFCTSEESVLRLRYLLTIWVLFVCSVSVIKLVRDSRTRRQQTDEHRYHR